MILDYQLLQGNNLLWLLLLIGFDVFITGLIAWVWRKYKEKTKEQQPQEPQESMMEKK